MSWFFGIHSARPPWRRQKDLNVARGSICHWDWRRRLFCIWKMALLIQASSSSKQEKVTSQIFNLTFESSPHTPLFGAAPVWNESSEVEWRNLHLAKSFNTGLTRDFRSIASWLPVLRVWACVPPSSYDFQLMIFIKAFISSTKESVKNHLLGDQDLWSFDTWYYTKFLLSHMRKTKDLLCMRLWKRRGPWKV